MKDNIHEFLCKYFAGKPRYYDSETNEKLSGWRYVIEWDKKQYYKLESGVRQPAKPCYQVKDVTGLSVVSHLLEYMVGAFLGCVFLAIGVVVLYWVAYANYMLIICKNVGDGEYFLISVVSWICIVVGIGHVCYKLLEKWKIDECVLGKDDKDESN